MRFEEISYASIYLKSGQAISAWFSKLKVSYVGDSVEGIEWSILDGAQILYISLEDVSAVVVHKKKKRLRFKG